MLRPHRFIEAVRATYLMKIVAYLLGITLLGSGCYFPEVTLSDAERGEISANLFEDATSIKPTYKIGAVIEDQVRLIGFDIDRQQARPGEVITVTYYLEGLTDQPLDSEIFVHLQGKKSGAWQNLDHTPVRGLFPLRKLKRGQVLRDIQRFKIKRGYPTGVARLYWGLFTKRRRLKIKNLKAVKHDRRNRVLLGTIKVEPARPPVKVSAYGLAPSDHIVIDGRLNEPSWSYARWGRLWVDPLGRQRGKRGLRKAPPATRAKMVWTADALYIAIEARDRDVWATFTERDSNTWEQEVVEVFLDPNNDRRDYVELQVSPANIVFDAKFTHHRSDLKRARAWDYQGWETAVHVEGTLNKRDDRDQRYIVEMRLPLAGLPGAPNELRESSAPWRINLFRFDWDESPRGRQHAAALSPPYVGDFHSLDAFAELIFRPTRAPKPSAPLNVPVSPAEGTPTLTPNTSSR